MRSLNWFSRSIAKWSIAKWTLAIGSMSIGSMATESQALAHHPFRHHHHHHHGIGSFGWGSHYHDGYGYGGYGYGGYGYGGYGSFYSSYAYPSCYSSYGVFPRHFSINYYTPTYFAPVYYAPTYYAPTYYAPAVSPCYSWSSVQLNLGFPVAGNNTGSMPGAMPMSTLQGASLVASKSATSPFAMQTRGRQTQTLDGIPIAKLDPIEESTRAITQQKGIHLVSNKPALLQPYSPIWTKAAVGIVDDMVARGDLDHAYSSCKSMERITQPKGAGVYLRQALLSYFLIESSESKKPSTEEVLKLLELACEGGSMLQSSELSKESLQDYFAECTVDVSRTLEQLSRSVLESPNHSGQELLLLSGLLKLEGQESRSKLFATEVKAQAAKSNSFRWNSLLNVCLN